MGEDGVGLEWEVLERDFLEVGRDFAIMGASHNGIEKLGRRM